MTSIPWQKLVAKYQQPDTRRSVWQVVNSFGPYVLLWTLMVWSLRVSYALTLVLAVFAAGFMIRIFIIMHDCGHGSFLKSQKASNALGTVCGFLALTPYFQWRHNHALHHAHSGNLSKRLQWDLPMTLTVREFAALPEWRKLLYRVYRHPLVLFVLLPPLLFFFGQRLGSPGNGKRERESVILTNVVLAALAVGLGLWIGFKEVLLIQAPITVMGSIVGVWLFYIQHQYEETYFKEDEEWDYLFAALKGSSYYKLHPVLRWFTGNIGLHHVHHLSPRIPNYRLQECHDENPELQDVPTLTLKSSLKCATLRLWDEEIERMVGFSKVRGRTSTLQG